MSHFETGPLASYNSLTDPHLAAYFTNRRIRKHLCKSGLITKDGHVVSENIYRFNNARHEHQKQVREMIAQAIVHKALDMERMRQVTVRRKLEEIAKLQTVQRVRDEKRRKDEDILPLLTPRIICTSPQHHDSHSVKDQKQDGEKSLQKGAKHSGPVEQHHQNDEESGDSCSDEQFSNESAEINADKKKSKQRSTGKKYFKDEIDDRLLCSLDQRMLYEYNSIRRSTRSMYFHSPYTAVPPVIAGMVPAPPRARPKSSLPANQQRNQKSAEKWRPQTAHRLPAAKPECKVTMHYHGSSPKRDYDPFSRPRDQIVIEQQPFGAGTIVVFKGMLLPDSDFTFTSVRNHDYPFSLTLYVNGQNDCRLSTCCEFRRKAGLRIGGHNKGHFSLVSVSGGMPCFRCYKEGSEKSESGKKSKAKGYAEEDMRGRSSKTKNGSKASNRKGTTSGPNASKDTRDSDKAERSSNSIKHSSINKTETVEAYSKADFDTDDSSSEVDEPNALSSDGEKEEEAQDAEAATDDEYDSADDETGNAKHAKAHATSAKENKSKDSERSSRNSRNSWSSDDEDLEEKNGKNQDPSRAKQKVNEENESYGKYSIEDTDGQNVENDEPSGKENHEKLANVQHASEVKAKATNKESDNESSKAEEKNAKESSSSSSDESNDELESPDHNTLLDRKESENKDDRKNTGNPDQNILLDREKSQRLDEKDSKSSEQNNLLDRKESISSDHNSLLNGKESKSLDHDLHFGMEDALSKNTVNPNQKTLLERKSSTYSLNSESESSSSSSSDSEDDSDHHVKVSADTLTIAQTRAQSNTELYSHHDKNEEDIKAEESEEKSKINEFTGEEVQGQEKESRDTDKEEEEEDEDDGKKNQDTDSDGSKEDDDEDKNFDNKSKRSSKRSSFSESSSRVSSSEASISSFVQVHRASGSVNHNIDERKETENSKAGAILMHKTGHNDTSEKKNDLDQESMLQELLFKDVEEKEAPNKVQNSEQECLKLLNNIENYYIQEAKTFDEELLAQDTDKVTNDRTKADTDKDDSSDSDDSSDNDISLDAEDLARAEVERTSKTKNSQKGSDISATLSTQK